MIVINKNVKNFINNNDVKQIMQIIKKNKWYLITHFNNFIIIDLKH